MLLGVLPVLEKHHGVTILRDAVSEAVRLSSRYIAGRQLPDKAVSLLDTACSKVALAGASPPVAIEQLRHRLSTIEADRRLLERESTLISADNQVVLEEVRTRHTECAQQLEAALGRWKQEATLVDEIRQLRKGEDFTAEDQDRLRRLQHELAEVQAEDPLVPELVDEQAVANVVSSWTGIPVTRMGGDEVNAVLSLKSRLAERVVGQDHALENYRGEYCDISRWSW